MAQQLIVNQDGMSREPEEKCRSDGGGTDSGDAEVKDYFFVCVLTGKRAFKKIVKEMDDGGQGDRDGNRKETG